MQCKKKIIEYEIPYQGTLAQNSKPSPEPLSTLPQLHPGWKDKWDCAFQAHRGLLATKNPVVQGKLLLAYTGLAPPKTSAKAQQEEEGEASLLLLQNLSKEDTPQPVSRPFATSTRCMRAPSSMQPRHKSTASSLLCFCRLKTKPETTSAPHSTDFLWPRRSQHCPVPISITLAANLIGKKKSPRSLTNTLSTLTFKHSWNSQSQS